MRITGGSLKGRVVEAPRGVLSRPPLSVIRESVFNSIGDGIRGKRVLDLFAGSGSLGIEAISRGAGHVHFVDSARRCAEMIERNARNLGIEQMCAVSRQDAADFVRGWREGAFDYIFVDPPFLSGKAGETLAAFDGGAAFAEGTLVVARIHWRERLELPGGVRVARTRKFGDSLVLYIRRTLQGTGE
jgi:16S rRNA (guanine(966)-N(2))-methyltransferase RsmD